MTNNLNNQIPRLRVQPAELVCSPQYVAQVYKTSYVYL